MKISDYVNLQRAPAKVKAGAAIAVNDLVQLGLDGLGYPVQVSDSAAVANCSYGTPQTTAATGVVIANTTITASPSNYSYARAAALTDSDNNIYTFIENTVNVGLLLIKFSPSGTILSSVILASTGNYSAHRILLLSNGNICVTAVNTTNVIFAIYTQALLVVAPVTSLVETTTSGATYSSCTLSGGGFAITYQLGSTPLTSRLVTYDNVGNVVTSPVTIWTRTGTSGAQFPNMLQLQSGDLVVACNSTNTVSSIGLYYAVITQAGAIVKGFTQLDTGSMSIYPELAVSQVYFAIARANSVNQLAFVFDVAGNLQGSGFTQATTQGSGRSQIKLLADENDFKLLWIIGASPKLMLTKIPFSGFNCTSTDISPSGFLASSKIDAFCKNDYIIFADFLSSPSVYVIDKSIGRLLSTSSTIFGAETSGTTTPRLISISLYTTL